MKVLRFVVVGLLAIAVAACLILTEPRIIHAQEGMEGSGGDMMGNEASIPSATPGASTALPPIPQIPIMEPVSGTMMASPPYGTAPLAVGFFVLANDPENIGFLTYQWNFGDGMVSSLPPELYIAHVYKNPGNYVCTMVAKTADGRSITFIQGILVKPAQD